MRSTYEDPPEYRDAGGGGGGFGGGGMSGLAFPTMTPVTRKLLLANGLVFLLFLLLERLVPSVGWPLKKFLLLDPVAWREWAPLFPVWQVFTYGFLHDYKDPLHILYNMLLLYFFGSMLEGIIGGRRLFVHYCAALVFGGIVQIAANLISGTELGTLGASGAVLALLIAVATLRPHTRIIFIFIPMTLKTLALILVGLDVYRLIVGGSNVAVLVHMSGAAYGFFAARRSWLWLDPLEAYGEWKERSEDQKSVDDEARLDQLLDRINREGLSSLSSRERKFLRSVSRRR